MVCARTLVSLSLLSAVPAFGDSSVATQVWNGTSWGSNAKVVAGSSVYVRYTISTNNTNAAALNFANFQPTIGGWTEGDLVNLGLTTGGSNGNPSAGVDSNFADGNGYGRVAAFAYANISAANTLKAHTNVPGILRIAATPVTNAPGTGTSLNNFNGSGGVPLAQSIGGPGRAAGSPAIVAGTSVVVYGVAITLSGTRSIGDTLNLNVAAFGTGGVVRWFTASELASGSLISSINDGVPSTLTGATIEIVPAPASVAILGASGLITGWRRR